MIDLLSYAVTRAALALRDCFRPLVSQPDCCGNRHREPDTRSQRLCALNADGRSPIHLTKGKTMNRARVIFTIIAAVILTKTMAQARSAQTAFDVMDKTIPELQAAMTTGAITSRQLAQIYFARIAAYDQQGPALNTLVALNAQALAAADALDAERKAGKIRGPLHGIPILIKDNYETIEMPTTVGSIALRTFHPRNDAFQVRRLKEAGAIILGKTNMHELAMGIFTVSSSGGQTRNPYDLNRNPGGSSGGTGAAVAANFAVAGMGSDTCGSIRIPAAHNNLVGLRGTQGLSSRSGIVSCRAVS